MTTRLRDQIAFRVTPTQRRTIEKAARSAGRNVSEWARLVVMTESDIQVETKHYGKPLETVVADGTRGMERGR